MHLFVWPAQITYPYYTYPLFICPYLASNYISTFLYFRWVIYPLLKFLTSVS